MPSARYSPLKCRQCGKMIGHDDNHTAYGNKDGTFSCRKCHE